MLFQKYAMISVLKTPKICVNVHYFTNREFKRCNHFLFPLECFSDDFPEDRSSNISKCNGIQLTLAGSDVTS